MYYPFKSSAKRTAPLENTKMMSATDFHDSSVTGFHKRQRWECLRMSLVEDQERDLTLQGLSALLINDL